jgi:hypothetical protein
MLHMEISTSLCLTEGRKRPLLSAPSITDQTQVRSRQVRVHGLDVWIIVVYVCVRLFKKS